MEKISLNVNGDLRVIEVNPETPLLFVLRNNLRLKGTKLGCTLEQCGACAVLVNGEKSLSCVRNVKEFEDTNVVTIEGLSKDGQLDNIQKAFNGIHLPFFELDLPSVFVHSKILNIMFQLTTSSRFFWKDDSTSDKFLPRFKKIPYEPKT